jgi:hypothetical protein
MADTIRASFQNLNEVRRQLNAIEIGLPKELTSELEESSRYLVGLTRLLTPVGPGPGPWLGHSDDDLPHMRDMFEVQARGGTIALITTHPGGLVHEWGGTIQPAGQPITIKRSQMGHRALKTELPRLEAAVIERIDALIARNS